MKNTYKLEDKLEIIEKYNESDLSKVEFCKKNGITPVTLRTWIKEVQSPKIAPKFIELEIKQEQTSEIEIKFDNFIIKVDKNTDFNILGNLIKLVNSI